MRALDPTTATGWLVGLVACWLLVAVLFAATVLIVGVLERRRYRFRVARYSGPCAPVVALDLERARRARRLRERSHQIPAAGLNRTMAGRARGAQASPTGPRLALVSSPTDERGGDAA